MTIKTFLDTGVLISAWRGDPSRQIKALTILSDAQREFVCSPFIKLELLPKAHYYRNRTETAFYERYFASVSEWVDDLDQLYLEGMSVGKKFGLEAMDALHIAAALISNCQDFVNNEKPTSPFSRVTGLHLLIIY